MVIRLAEVKSWPEDAHLCYPAKQAVSHAVCVHYIDRAILRIRLGVGEDIVGGVWNIWLSVERPGRSIHIDGARALSIWYEGVEEVSMYCLHQ